MRDGCVSRRGLNDGRVARSARKLRIHVAKLARRMKSSCHNQNFLELLSIVPDVEKLVAEVDQCSESAHEHRTPDAMDVACSEVLIKPEGSYFGVKQSSPNSASASIETAPARYKTCKESSRPLAGWSSVIENTIKSCRGH